MLASGACQEEARFSSWVGPFCIAPKPQTEQHVRKFTMIAIGHWSSALTVILQFLFAAVDLYDAILVDVLENVGSIH